VRKVLGSENGAAARGRGAVKAWRSQVENDLQWTGGGEGRRGEQKKVERVGENRTDNNHAGEARDATHNTARKHQKPRQKKSSAGNVRRQRRKINIITSTSSNIQLHEVGAKKKTIAPTLQFHDAATRLHK